MERIIPEKKVFLGGARPKERLCKYFSFFFLIKYPDLLNLLMQIVNITLYIFHKLYLF